MDMKWTVGARRTGDILIRMGFPILGPSGQWLAYVGSAENARLIAAAPEMAEVLAQLLDEGNTMRVGDRVRAILGNI